MRGSTAALQLHESQQFPDLFPNRRPIRPIRFPADVQPEGDVVRHAHVAEQRVVLEHHANLAFARRKAAHFLVMEQQRPASGIGRIQSGDDAQQGGLAGSRRADKGDQLTGFDRQVHARQGGGPAKGFGDAVRLNTHFA